MTVDKPKADPEFDALIAECWPKAQAHWSQFLLMQPPVVDVAQPSIAHIHLGMRQVGLHQEEIRDKKLEDCIEAILAHEVGHHVRYPATLAVHARLRLIEKTLLPLPNYSVINLFTDLLINDALRPAFEGQIVRIYQAFGSNPTTGSDPKLKEPDPAFLFYLAIYEERWGLEPGSLLGTRCEAFGNKHPGFRADAQVLGQNLFHVGPNLYTQFIYFVSVVSRYVDLEATVAGARPYQCNADDPSADDWAEALTPDAREREAIERARAEGWIRREIADRLNDAETLQRRIWSLPGSQSADATLVPEVMAAFYRREAERYLLKPPPQRRIGEATTPTTLHDWEPGDAVREIDWNATLMERGLVLGSALPLKRERVSEMEGWDIPLWQPRVEIYLDVSGSMPDPRFCRNAMTLAAQILCSGAMRANGWVRSVLYSSSPVIFWEWCRTESEMSRFLMHYIGGGTDFPFDLLTKSVRECGNDQPIRVVISDHDFHMNYEATPSAASAFAEAARASPHLVLMLHLADDDRTDRYRAAGARVIRVAELEDYPGMAAALSQALFVRESSGPD